MKTWIASALLVLVCAWPVQADPITSARLAPSGEFQMTAENFSFSGFASTYDGLFGPVLYEPGSGFLSLNFYSMGLGTRGRATYDSIEYGVGGMESLSFLTLRFLAGLDLPAVSAPSLVTTIPLALYAQFNYVSDGWTQNLVDFVGHGMATVRLAALGGEYRYQSVEYDIAHAPEPATMLLMGTGLLWVGRRYARR